MEQNQMQIEVEVWVQRDILTMGGWLETQEHTGTASSFNQ